MRTNIIRIGNSQGIRIPKILLEQSQLGPEVELEVEEQKIVIRAATRPRQGWEEKMRLLAEQGDDHLAAELPAPTAWEQNEWQW